VVQKAGGYPGSTDEFRLKVLISALSNVLESGKTQDKLNDILSFSSQVSSESLA
jgi:hypothetical protein